MSDFHVSRRRILLSGASALAGGAFFLRNAYGQMPPMPGTSNGSPSPKSKSEPTTTPPSRGELGYTPVVTPNGSTLPWQLVDGVKVFHLIAEPLKREFAPGLMVDCWGYNGETPGPTIEAVEGDRCRFYVTNNLPEPTTVHWHGVFLPNGMDGVAGMTQPYIKPGETFKYEFTLRQHGTFMYHPHFDEMLQMGMGMMGMFIIHPKDRTGLEVDRDFAIMLSEWAIKPGTSKPDTTVMSDFNILTMNSKAFPGTAPLVVSKGQKVRIRFGNLGAMDHHPIHLHGYRFLITATDGGRIPEAGQWPETTVLVPVGSTRDVEFVADEPGDWAMHCHMTHHVMNQMGHELPNMLGVDTKGLDEKIHKVLPDYMSMGSEGMGNMMMMGSPRNSIPMMGGEGKFGTIDMGGMFTILKVRDELTTFEDPGPYDFPSGTVASKASDDELQKDLGSKAPRNRSAKQTKESGTGMHTCQMHPEVQVAKPGKCPKCGMKLVPMHSQDS